MILHSSRGVALAALATLILAAVALTSHAGGDLFAGVRPPAYGRRHAIVIGIDAYTSPRFGPLGAAAADALEVAEVLSTRYGFEDVVLVTDPAPLRGHDGVRPAPGPVTVDHLRTTLTAMQVDPTDALLVYFAGHGDRRGVVAADGETLPYDDLLALIQEKAAHHTLLILDACHSGAALAADVPAAGRLRSTLTGRPPVMHSVGDDLSRIFNRSAVQVICAGAADDRVPDEAARSRRYAELAFATPGRHSPFTLALLRGLHGLTGRPDGRVLATDLGHYVVRTLGDDPAWANLQSPRYGVVAGEGEFLFAPRDAVIDPSLVAPLYLTASGYSDLRAAACEGLVAHIANAQPAVQGPLVAQAVFHLTHVLKNDQGAPLEAAAGATLALMTAAPKPEQEWAPLVQPLTDLVSKSPGDGLAALAAQALGKVTGLAGEMSVQAVTKHIEVLRARWHDVMRRGAVPSDIVARVLSAEAAARPAPGAWPLEAGWLERLRWEYTYALSPGSLRMIVEHRADQRALFSNAGNQARVALRFDLAELAFANAVALGDEDSRALYLDSRKRRRLVPAGHTTIPRGTTLCLATEWRERPFLVTFDPMTKVTTVRGWTDATQRFELVLPGRTNDAPEVAVQRDLLGALADGTVRAFNLRTGEQLGAPIPGDSLAAGRGGLHIVAVPPADERSIVLTSIDPDGDRRVQRIGMGAKVAQVLVHPDGVAYAALTDAATDRLVVARAEAGRRPPGWRLSEERTADGLLLVGQFRVSPSGRAFSVTTLETDPADPMGPSKQVTILGRDQTTLLGEVQPGRGALRDLTGSWTKAVPLDHPRYWGAVLEGGNVRLAELAPAVVAEERLGPTIQTSTTAVAEWIAPDRGALEEGPYLITTTEDGVLTLHNGIVPLVTLPVARPELEYHRLHVHAGHELVAVETEQGVAWFRLAHPPSTDTVPTPEEVARELGLTVHADGTVGESWISAAPVKGADKQGEPLGIGSLVATVDPVTRHALDVPVGTEVEVRLRHDPGAGELTLTLLDEGDQQLASGIRLAPDETVAVAVIAAGATVRVDGTAAVAGARYELTLKTLAPNAHEPNDEQAQAKRLGAPGTLPGLRCDGSDWFQVSITSGRVLDVRIASAWPNVDLDLEVCDLEGNKVASSTSNGGAERCCAFGRSDLFIHVYQGLAPYELVWSERTPTPVVASQRLQGQCDASEWHRIDAPPGETILVRLDIGSEQDLELAVLDVSGNELGASNGNSTTEVIKVTVPIDGGLFAHVYPASSSGISTPYWIGWQAFSATAIAPLVPGARIEGTNGLDRLRAASRVPVVVRADFEGGEGQVVVRSADGADVADSGVPMAHASLALVAEPGDVVGVTVDAGRPHVIRIDALPEVGPGQHGPFAWTEAGWHLVRLPATGDLRVSIGFAQELDLDLEAFDLRGQSLGRANERRERESLTLPVPAEGLIIRVRSFIGVPGDYSLVVAAEEGAVASPFEPNDSATEARSLTPGAYEEVLCDGEDWFRLEAPPHHRVEARITFEHAEGDLDLQVCDASERVLQASQLMQDSEEVVCVSDPAGPLLLRVFNATARYRLHWFSSPLPSIGVGQDTEDVCTGDDLVRIDLPPDQLAHVRLAFNAADGELELHLLDRSGRLLAESTGTRGEEAAACVVPVDGALYARVHGATNLYNLSVRRDGPHEPNDTHDAAAPLTPGRHDGLACSGEDWFRVRLEPGRRAAVSLRMSEATALLSLTLHDGAGRELARGAPGRMASATAQVPPDGALLVRVHGPRAGYGLSIGCEDGFEPNQVPDQAAQLGPARVGLYCDGSDDWFAVDLPAGTLVSMRLVFDPESQLTLELRDVHRRVLTGHAIRETGSIVSVLTVPEGGLLLCVRGRPGTYSLTIERVAPGAGEPNDTLRQATLAGPGVHGEIMCNGEDWYRLDLPAGVIAEVELGHASSGDLDLFLCGADGRPLVSAATTNPLEHATIVVPRWGLFARVRGTPSTGYFLHVDASSPFEPNDDAMRATVLPPGRYAGLPRRGEDWFAPEASPGQRLEVSARAQAGSIAIVLCDSSGAPLPVTPRADGMSTAVVPTGGLLVRVHGDAVEYDLEMKLVPE